MRFDQVLKVAVHGGASDIILKQGSFPRFRHQGQLVSLADGEEINADIMTQWVDSILPPHLLSILDQKGDVDFAYTTRDESRFRVNIFKQQGHFGMVLRVLSNQVRTLEELQMPKALFNFGELRRGLVLVTGATGSGKTTTLAAILERINSTRNSHVITIEDPIEFVFRDKKSTFNQREVGRDVESFSSALKAALRQSPDVILVGELRDKETTETALMAAETGHLVLSTLHTVDAVDSLTRLLSYFSPHQHTAIRNQLAGTLHGVVSQRLVRRSDGQGLVPALEVMIVNSMIRECILRETTFELVADAITKGGEAYGMQSFDQSLLQLFTKGIITKKEALSQSSSPDKMRLLFGGITK
jgi:twitching motility protein PilT